MYLPRIKFCYQKELVKNPKLFGKITIRFIIGKDGRVSMAKVQSSTMHNKIVENCVVRVFYQMAFPKPRGGGIVIVTYPFIFKAAG